MILMQRKERYHKKRENYRQTSMINIDGKIRPVQIRHHIFLILKIKETFPTMHVQKGPLEIKRGVMSPTHSPLH